MALNNVNLMGGGAPPYDLQAQQNTLQQQLAIAQALIAKSMEDHSPIIRTGGGNPFARDVANFGDPIASVAQALMGNRQRDEANRGLNELGAETRRRTASDMDTITRKRLGIESPNLAADDEGNAYPPVMGRPDYGGAMRVAQQSTVPAINALGVKMIEDIPSPKDFLQYGDKFDPAGLAGFGKTLDPTALAGRGKLDVSGGVATSSQDGKVTGVQPTETFGAPKINPIGVPVQASNVTNREHAYGQYGDVSTTKSRENALSAEDMKQLGEGRKSYLEGLKGIGNIAQLQTDIQGIDPDRFGSFADFRTSAQKFAKMLGGEISDQNATMETVHSSLGNLMIAKIRALAPVTKEDISMMQSVIGSENNTKAALERILDIAAQATIRDQLTPHRKFVENLSQQPGMDAGMIQRYAPDFNITSLPPMAPRPGLRKKYGIPDQP